MNTVMRAKLIIDGVEQFEDAERLSFRAVAKDDSYPEDGSDENNTFARFTPSANLTMYVNNPELLGKFTTGQSFYVDFTPAD